MYTDYEMISYEEPRYRSFRTQYRADGRDHESNIFMGEQYLGYILFDKYILYDKKCNPKCSIYRYHRDEMNNCTPVIECGSFVEALDWFCSAYKDFKEVDF
jgi:hypothetical protein